MRIIVVGAGAVGSYLAERFSTEGQDVVVIESDADRAGQMQAELDCLVITGNGASAATIEQAMTDKTEMLIAVSSSDAVNVLACYAATKLGIPRTIARVEDPELKAEVEALGVDLVIDPGEAAARDLLTLVTSGPVAEHVEFADGGLLLIGTFVGTGSPVVGTTLAQLREKVQDWDWLVVAVVRRGETMIARGSTVLESGDHVLLMASADHTEEPYRLLGLAESSPNKVIILGGTRLASMTAQLLAEQDIDTVIIDSDRSRCRTFAETLPDTVVVCGDPSDPRVLKDVGIGSNDAVLALTGWDGLNLLGGLVARALGAGEVIARFTNTDYVGLLGGFGIDATVSSRLSAANEILRFVRRGRIFSAVTVPGSEAEAIELEVSATSPAVGKTLAQLKLPKSVIVGGIQRNGASFVPRGTTEVHAGDHLIVIALPDGIGLAEQLSG